MVSVDAILCYHNHEPYLQRCLDSLAGQVRQFLLIEDGGEPLIDGKYTRNYPLAHLRRTERHNAANTFNYGAFHSNADWLLYVDPHTIFFPESIKKMLAVAGDDYDFVWGRGWVSFLDPDTPWGKILAKSDLTEEIPLTFMMRRELWDTLKGIPEPQYCHMDVLAELLFTKGIVPAALSKMCHHHIAGEFPVDIIRYYFQSGLSYARSGLTFPQIEAVKGYTPQHLAQLLSALFSSAYCIGAMEGLGMLPDEALDITDFMLSWGEEV